TVFRQADGTLYAEELVSTRGFSGTYSLVYHCHPPTLVKETGKPFSVEPAIARGKHLRHLRLSGFDIPPEADYLQSRKPVLVNQDLQLSLAAPTQSMRDYFYKNRDRKSTRLNSSHVKISYAVFCLKKKTQPRDALRTQTHE